MSNRITHLKASHYFSVASQTLSYTKAAQQLNVSQAAVSQQIRLLEDYLGVPLFYRSGRDMRLTSQGQQLAEHLEQAFKHIGEGLDSVKLEPLEGILQVSGLQSFVSLWLMPKLWRFSDRHQEISVKLFSADEQEDIHGGNIDVSIDCLVNRQENAIQRLLITSDIIPVCSPELAERIGFTQPSDLLKCWMIEVGDSTYCWNSWFDELGICPIRSKSLLWAEVNSWYMGISAVKAGHGIFLCPRFMVEDDLLSGALVQAHPKALNTQIQFYAHYAKSSPRKARIEAFIAWLQLETSHRHEQRVKTALHQPLPWP
ncbi:LysR substrate-binding domain-containing protein [Marinomonas profundimaris]|uniref:LysR family transcriptional regulator n=1 Tax=Marinomonas profundimaris TaxID=1208321 RepID=W1RSP7_9GAMM|nr:LysR substrate-binding domain-containing protein [Marinomonas profundimaris]ETI59800.1 LysR family transcriptional regulator [Marinomonas profundimaris]